MASSCEGDCASCQQTTPDCQKSDYASHKSICSARQQLFRGAKALKQVFLMFREMTYDMDLWEVITSGEEIQSYIPIYYYAVKKVPLYASRNDLVTNEADKEALLAYRSCVLALSYLFPLMSKVLEGITSTESPPVEVEFSTKKSAMKVHNHVIGSDFSQRSPHHQLLAVSLENGETSAIDLAGAQYRQYQAVVPWNAYSKRIIEVKRRNEFGYEARQDPLQLALMLNGAHASRGSDVRYDTRVHAIQAEIAKALVAGVEQWESSAGKTVAQMLRTKTSIFENNVKKFLGCVNISVALALKNGQAQSKPLPAVGCVFAEAGADATKEKQQEEEDASQSQASEDATTKEKTSEKVKLEDQGPKNLDEMVNDRFGRLLIAHGAATDKFFR